MVQWQSVHVAKFFSFLRCGLGHLWPPPGYASALSHIHHCSQPHAPPAWAFTNAQIISYFVTRTADDGLPVADFKSLNNSAGNLYHCGHVQKIEVC